MGSGWTVKANLVSLNKSVNKYVKKFDVDMGEMVRYLSVGIIKEVAKNNPVRTGRSRAAWLPFLWSQNVQDVSVEWSDRVTPAEGLKGSRQGLRLEKHRYKFWDTDKPFASITNRVHYTKYLEYGVRKTNKAKAMSGTKAAELGLLSAVSGQSKPGFVRTAIKRNRDELRMAVKNNKKLKLR